MAQVTQRRKHVGARAFCRALAGTLAAAGLMMLPRPAAAQGRELLTATGAKGQLAIDQISGFRASFVPGYGPGVDYYGPIGFAIQRYSEAAGGTPGNDVFHTTTFWIAPSADIFVIDHLSIGGLIEFSTTSGSTSTPDPHNPNVSINATLPTLTNFTILPRVGYLIPLGDRWGIWPRAGLGFALREQSNADNSRDTIHGLAVDLDCGFLFRFTETFFARLAPELGWLPAGSHTNTPAGGGASISADANFLQFTVTGGIGVLLPL